MHLLVVGAGVFGAASALELRRRGHDVTLLEAGPLGRQQAASTDRSKLVRLEYGDDEPSTALMERALPRWRAWTEAFRAAGEPPPFHEDGVLILSRGPLRAGSFEGDSHALLSRRGHALQRLGGGALAARHPAWRHSPLADGWWNPQGGWAEPTRVTRWLAESAAAAGAVLRTGHSLVELRERGGRVAGAVARDAGGRRVELDADAVVLAAGAWCPQSLPGLAADLPLRVVAQAICFFRPARPEEFAAPAFPPFAADVARTGFYGFPALPDGRVKLGHHGEGLAVTDADGPRVAPPEAVERARGFLREHLPSLADAPLAEARLCLYDDTPDSRFLIDEHPRRPGLWLAAGGSGHAFKFAPVLGELVADALLRRADSPHAGFLQRCRWRSGTAAADTSGDAARAGKMAARPEGA
jgi:glycine/D-amino acid oxidase-like deaminating enzyme